MHTHAFRMSIGLLSPIRRRQQEASKQTRKEGINAVNPSTNVCHSSTTTNLTSHSPLLCLKTKQPGTFAPPNDFGKRTLLWVDLPAVWRWATGGEEEGKEEGYYVLAVAAPEGEEQQGNDDGE